MVDYLQEISVRVTEVTETVTMVYLDEKSEFTTKGELVYLPIVEGEYCPRTTTTCIGKRCRDYGENGCKVYFRSPLSRSNEVNPVEWFIYC